MSSASTRIDIMEDDSESISTMTNEGKDTLLMEMHKMLKRSMRRNTSGVGKKIQP
jgi:hypothetical protein